MSERMRTAWRVIPEWRWKREPPRCSLCATPLGRECDVIADGKDWAHAYCHMERYP